VTDLAQLTAAEQARLIRSGATSAEEVLQATLDRVQALNPRLNAFLTISEESARREARMADEAVRAGRPLGRLHGVPIALKDNFETRGVLTTAGSRVLEGNVPERDATVVARLREAGAVIVGKTQLSEFAMGPSAFGDMRNPWDLERLAGASSGGSGAAVAARLCPIAMGSDTGGSIRIPASFSGVVGLKPTYGRVSRSGLLAADWSLDHAGPLTRTVEDAAITLAVIAGHDASDPSSSRARVPDYLAQLDEGVAGLRIGLPAISIPSGFNAAGLPMGVQVVGRPFDEATILRVAHAYQQKTNWQDRRPPV
jgi:aspartyl-tRNA(Asn)/glutamyl-tRNA(Gln) amidotransferase subunit A